MGVQKIFDNTPYCEMCTDRPAIKRFRGIMLCDDCLGMAATIEIVGKNWSAGKIVNGVAEKRIIPCPACKNPICVVFHPDGVWPFSCPWCAKVVEWKPDG